MFISKGYDKIVDMLVKSGANLDYLDHLNFTALHHSANNGN